MRKSQLKVGDGIEYIKYSNWFFGNMSHLIINPPRGFIGNIREVSDVGHEFFKFDNWYRGYVRGSENKSENWFYIDEIKFRRPIKTKKL